MRFKGSKEEILQKVTDQVYNNCYIHIDQYNMTNNMNAAKQQVEWAIKNAISAGFRELIDNIYTEEEFEQDLGLNKP